MVLADEPKSEEIKNYTITLIANREGAKFNSGYEGTTYSDDYAVATFTCPSNEAIRYAKGFPYTPYLERSESESVWWDCNERSWNSKEDGTGESFDLETTRPSHDMTLYATWVQKTRVTLHANGGYFGTSADCIENHYTRPIKENFSYSISVPVAPVGKAFNGWYKDPECTQKVESLPQEEISETNRDFYAGWTDQNVVTVTLDPNGGKFERYYEPYKMQDGKLLQNLIAGEYADSISNDCIKRDGYRFTGWYLDPECTQKVTNQIVKKDTTYYAGWTDSTDNYELTFLAKEPGYYWGQDDEGYSARVHSLKYSVPKGFSISEAERLNYVYLYPDFDTATVKLDSMYLNENATERINELWQYTPTKDTTFYAIYKEYSNVKWYAGEGGYFKYRSTDAGSNNFETEQVIKDDAANLYSSLLDGSELANKNPNLTFLGWYKQDPATGEVTNEKLDSTQKLVPTGDVTYQAKWANGNEVTFDLNGGKTYGQDEDGNWNDNITEVKKKIAEGTSVERTLATFERHIWKEYSETDQKIALTGWYTDKECTQSYDLTAPITAPLTLYAKWEEPEITINVSPSDSVRIGDQITATATSNMRNGSEDFDWDLEDNYNDDGQSMFAQISDSNIGDKFVIQATNAGTARIICYHSGTVSKEVTAVDVAEEDKKPAVSISGSSNAKNTIIGGNHSVEEANAANTIIDTLKDQSDSATGDGITQAISLAAANNTVNAEDYRDDLKKNDDSVTSETKLSTVYESYMDYNVTDIHIPAVDSKDDQTKSVTFEATPMLQKYVTTEENAKGAENGTVKLSDGNNAVKVGDPTKLNVVAPVTMKIPVPNNLFSDTDKIYVQHNLKNSRKQYDAQLSDSDTEGKYVTFENPDGFSTFTITTQDDSVATVDNKYYLDFTDAINAAAQSGKSMVLHMDLSGNFDADLYGSKNVTIELNGHNFDPKNINYFPDNDEYEMQLTKSEDGTKYFITIKEKEPDNPTQPSGGSSYHYTPAPAKTFVFDDVKDAEKFYYNPVYWAYKTGITAGTSEKTFSPGETCTRAQIVTMLWKKAGSPASSTDISKFTDVKSSKFYAKAVAWALEKGITTGTSQTTFSPNATCTRAQAMTFLYKMEKVQNTSAQNPFSDVVKGKFYYDPVLWGVTNGITTGSTNTTFNPSGKVNRGQMVTFLYNLYSGEKTSK